MPPTVATAMAAPAPAATRAWVTNEALAIAWKTPTPVLDVATAIDEAVP